MSAIDDDLAKLLSDVRSTIGENQRFLKTLADDVVEEEDTPEEEARTGENGDSDEEYEEL